MPAPMHLRIFVSSPGDVADERAFAQQVIEQELPKDPLLRGQITCEAMRWDERLTIGRVWVQLGSNSRS